MTTLHGSKIVLRPFRPEDTEALYQGVQDPESKRLTGTHAKFTYEQIEKYVLSRGEQDDRETFVIAHPETDAIVGEIVLMDIDDINRNTVLRIALFHEAEFGKGYGTEALRLVLDYAFKTLKLHRVGLDVFDFNPRAIHVYEKLGFKREGVERDSLFYEGTFHDSIIMGILEDEWQG